MAKTYEDRKEYYRERHRKAMALRGRRDLSRPCATCGRTFAGGSAAARYCSPECRVKSSARKPLCTACKQKRVSRSGQTYCDGCRDGAMAQTFNRPPRSKRATVLSAQSEAVLRTIADPFEAVEAHVPTTHATSHDRSVLAGDDFEAFLLRQRARIRAA